VLLGLLLVRHRPALLQHEIREDEAALPARKPVLVEVHLAGFDRNATCDKPSPPP
jgi:hypothetical protein